MTGNTLQGEPAPGRGPADAANGAPLASKKTEQGAKLRRDLLIYGLGGIIVPFIGIKAIDLVVAALHLA